MRSSINAGDSIRCDHLDKRYLVISPPTQTESEVRPRTPSIVHLTGTALNTVNRPNGRHKGG
jgi:hypothetical protein